MLDLFKDTGIPEEKQHPKFKLLKNFELTREREILKNWTRGFIDRDNKIIQEFQTTFHSSFWEFYLYAFFCELGLKPDFSKNRPDLIFNTPHLSTKRILVEAVVSNIKQGGRTEDARNDDDILSMLIPPHLRDNYSEQFNEAVARHSNAIQEKSKKYIEKYRKLEWVEETHPFVIGVAAYDQVNYGNEFHYPMTALLYGYCFDPYDQEYIKKNNIVKVGTNSEIPIGIFNNPENNHISAVMFSCTVTLGKLTSLAISKGDCLINDVITIRHDLDPPHYKIQEVSSDSPEYLSDGVFIFHNPNAVNPLPSHIFKKTNAIQITVKKGGLFFEGENLPIVARFNHPVLLKSEISKNHIYQLIHEGFNG